MAFDKQKAPSDDLFHLVLEKSLKSVQKDYDELELGMKIKEDNKLIKETSFLALERLYRHIYTVCRRGNNPDEQGWMYTYVTNTRDELLAKHKERVWKKHRIMAWPYRRELYNCVAGIAGSEVHFERVDRLHEDVYVLDINDSFQYTMNRLVTYIDELPRKNYVNLGAAAVRNLAVNRMCYELNKAFKLSEVVIERPREVKDDIPSHFVPVLEDDGDGDETFTADASGEFYHDRFDHVFKLATLGQNILLIGPAGSGKTYLAHQIANRLGVSFAAQSCSAGMSEAQLSGWLLPISKGNFEYVASMFVQLYENGGVFLFDEVDAADENTLIFINGAIAGEGFYLPQRFDNQYVKRHDNFVCIAAANTFGHGGSTMYSGRNRLDTATLDRFRAGVVEIDYSDRLEKSIIDKEVYKYCRRIREFIKRMGFNRVVSTRLMLDFTVQKNELGYTATEWAKSYFADWSEDELEAAKQAQLVR